MCLRFFLSRQDSVVMTKNFVPRFYAHDFDNCELHLNEAASWLKHVNLISIPRLRVKNEAKFMTQNGRRNIWNNDNKVFRVKKQEHISATASFVWHVPKFCEKVLSHNIQLVWIRASWSKDKMITILIVHVTSCAPLLQTLHPTKHFYASIPFK